MRIAIFLSLLTTCIVVFVGVESAKQRQYVKKNGECREYIPNSEKSPAKQVYKDKECSTISKSKRGRKKQFKKKEQSATNVQAPKKKLGPKETSLKKKKERRTRTAVVSSRKTEAGINNNKKSLGLARKRKKSSSQNAIRSKSNRKTNTANKVGELRKQPAKRKSQKSKNSTTAKPQPVKRSIVNGTPKNKKSKSAKQSDAQWPVATEEKSGCFLTHRNGTSIGVKKRCQSIKIPHFFLKYDSCYKVLNNKVKETKLEDLSLCDLPNKYPRYVLIKNKCVFKILSKKTARSFTKKTVCRKSASKMFKKSYKRIKQGVANTTDTATDTTATDTQPADVIEDINNVPTLNAESGPGPEDDDDGEDEDEDDDDDGEEDGETESGENGFDMDNYDTIETEKVDNTVVAPPSPNTDQSSSRHSPRPKCRLAHGRYNGQCIDATGFLKYAEKISLIDFGNFDLGRATELADRIYQTQLKANTFNFNSLKMAGGQAVGALTGDNPLAILTSLTSQMGNMEFCDVISKYGIVTDNHYKNFITPCD